MTIGLTGYVEDQVKERQKDLIYEALYNHWLELYDAAWGKFAKGSMAEAEAPANKMKIDLFEDAVQTFFPGFVREWYEAKGEEIEDRKTAQGY